MANGKVYASSGDGEKRCANPRCNKPLTVLRADVDDFRGDFAFCDSKCEREARLIRENERMLLTVRAAGWVH